ncbi:MAG TPA: serine/threonine-protein kinase [Polyangia bacterium]|nr:serine/threonine-protein kinase [Polyangia bacterium]
MGETLGVYHLEALAGEGGMGRVFRAVHEKLGRTVALKVLRRKYASRPEAVSRFLEEARAASRIRHPHLVEVTDFVSGEPDGDSYYIMEWLDGIDLAALLRRRGTIPADVVISFGRQLASVLAALHQAGIVHRDIKPENIFVIEVDGDYYLKLLDLGVALPTGGETLSAVAGTPAYFSPEAAAGGAVDARADIYSLGVVLYELLTGAPPFLGDTLAEYAMKHMTEKPRPVTEAAHGPVPHLLAQVIDRCLEKDPDRRFQSMAELADVFEALEQEGPGKPRRKRRRWVAIWVASSLAAATGIAGLVWLARYSRAPAAQPDALPAVVRTAPASTAPRSAPPAPGAERLPVELATKPPGAEVMRDGMTLGTTPCRVRLPRGPSMLKFRLPGYRTAERELDPERQPLLTISLERMAHHKNTDASLTDTVDAGRSGGGPTP